MPPRSKKSNSVSLKTDKSSDFGTEHVEAQAAGETRSIFGLMMCSSNIFLNFLQYPSKL